MSTTRSKNSVTAAQFNAQHPVGTRVRYWSWTREGEGVLSRTRAEAVVLAHGVSVVAVDGRAGCIALTHIEVVDQ